MRRSLRDWWLRVTRGGVKDAVTAEPRAYDWCCPTACAVGICGADDTHDAGCATPGRAFLSVAAGVWDCENCGVPTPLTHQSTFCKRTGESDVTVHWCCPDACQLDGPDFRRALDERRVRDMTISPDAEVPF